MLESWRLFFFSKAEREREAEKQTREKQRDTKTREKERGSSEREEGEREKERNRSRERARGREWLSEREEGSSVFARRERRRRLPRSKKEGVREGRRNRQGAKPAAATRSAVAEREREIGESERKKGGESQRGSSRERLGAPEIVSVVAENRRRRAGNRLRHAESHFHRNSFLTTIVVAASLPLVASTRRGLLLSTAFLSQNSISSHQLSTNHRPSRCFEALSQRLLCRCIRVLTPKRRKRKKKTKHGSHSKNRSFHALLRLRQFSLRGSPHAQFWRRLAPHGHHGWVRHFVPNLTIGAPVIESLRNHTKAYLDCHLMVTNPLDYVEPLGKAGASGFTFHVETSKDNWQELIDRIKSLGMRPGVALKPGTTVEEVFPLVEAENHVEMVLVMTVEPGFGGQKFMPEMMDKVRILRKKYPSLDIEVDGGLGPSTIDMATSAGANCIVAGSSVFGAPAPAEVISLLKNSVQKAQQTY